MSRVLQPVLAVGVVLQAGENHRPAGAATGGRAKSPVEARAIVGQCIEMRRAGDFVAIASQLASQVVGDDDDDVLGGGRGQIDLSKKCGEEHYRRSKPVAIHGARSRNNPAFDRWFHSPAWEPLCPRSSASRIYTRCIQPVREAEPRKAARSPGRAWEREKSVFHPLANDLSAFWGTGCHRDRLETCPTLLALHRLTQNP